VVSMCECHEECTARRIKGVEKGFNLLPRLHVVNF
jgi:hypothetical protein